MKYLCDIDSPEDLKRLDVKDFDVLAEEIRHAVIFRNSKVGGHVGPNLGFVEATIALHYVFNSPIDKIVFDVSHQSYPHKMLTGRLHGFSHDEGICEISGYTNPDESEHDFFSVGHTSTSISLACGLAKARDLKSEKNNIIAVIGDGSLSGGLALEGLSNAGAMNSNIIIILNDNEMSIAENYGGLYTNLRLLRQTNGQAECNIFKSLGFDYHYVEKGNSIPDMITVLEKVKDTNKPTIIHIHTNKGKGYSFAEENKEAWHWTFPFDVKTGEKTIDLSKTENYGNITFDYLSEKIKKDKDVVVLTAGTPGFFGLTSERRKSLGQNYIDVGIAEAHAVAVSSALAKGGCKPVFYVHSSFVQRTYDQLSQDLALNSNPAVILVFAGEISGRDMTHLGTFDIPLISNIPNVVYLSPTNKTEYLSMLSWGVEQTSHPVVIRVPSQVVKSDEVIKESYDNLNTYKTAHQGSEVAIIALGEFFGLGQKVAENLKNHNINATLINPRYITGIDEALLENLKQKHKLVITLESGQLDGGFGEKISRFYGTSNIKTINFGAKKEFTDRVPLQDLYKKYHLTPELIVEDILKNI